MPFKKRDGEYYFEAVQLFDDLRGEHGHAYAALCPVCAAKYKVLVKQEDREIHRVKQAIRNGDQLRIPLDLGEEPGSIRFVQTHLLDIQAVLSAELEQAG